MGSFHNARRFVAKLFGGKKGSIYSPWLLYYGTAAFPKEFDPYNPIVFNANSHPPLKSLQKQNKTLFAFLSLGQIQAAHPHFNTLK